LGRPSSTLAILGAWSNGFMYANWPQAAWKVTLLATGIVGTLPIDAGLLTQNIFGLGMDL